MSELASQNNSLIEFENHILSSLNLSNRVITTVIPASVLSTVEHNASVIKDLLTVSAAEYSEGVSNGTIVMELEYQDGSAFVDRAYSIFNNTKNISNNTNVITQILTDFSYLTDSINNLKDPAIINDLVVKIHNQLSSSGGYDSINDQKTPEDYISNIRELLGEIEIATTVYLDNFEFLQGIIGSGVSDRGEQLLREKLRQQINENATIDEIKQKSS